MKKIGIFGGTFNPPHRGHINAAKAFCDFIKPDLFFVVPTAIPPLKDKADVLAEKRLEMCRLAFDFASVSDFEVNGGGISYTYKTIEHFKSLYPDARLYLLIGTDQLMQLERWKKLDYLLENVIFAVVSRFSDTTAIDSAVAGHSDRFIRIPVSETVISSTDIRNGNGMDYLTANVSEYIKENKLYE